MGAALGVNDDSEPRIEPRKDREPSLDPNQPKIVRAEELEKLSYTPWLGPQDFPLAFTKTKVWRGMLGLRETSLCLKEF